MDTIQAENGCSEPEDISSIDPGSEASLPRAVDPPTELNILRQELERVCALLEAQAGMLTVEQVRELMAAKDDMVASRDDRIADLKRQLDARTAAEAELRQMLAAEQAEKQRLVQSQLFGQAEAELRQLAATDQSHGPTARQKLMKRLAEIGMAIGLLMLSLPHLQNTYAQIRQWQLHREEIAAQESRTSQESTSMFQGSAKPAKGAASTSDGSSDATYADKVASLQLTIPRLHVDSAVVEGVGDADLAQGPGHYPDTALPGEDGNCVIAAHRNLWGCEFAHLDQLQPHDMVKVSTLDHTYTYQVTGKNVVPPSDTSSLTPHGSQRELTLVTCTTPATRRIVVHSLLLSDAPTSGSGSRHKLPAASAVGAPTTGTM